MASGAISGGGGNSRLLIEREDALALLTPPFPPVRLVRRTGGIRKGARVELRRWGLPVDRAPYGS